MKTGYRTLIGLTAVLASFALPAAAQSSGNGPPLPQMAVPDEAGIDLLNGRRVAIDSAIAIGRDDDPAMNFTEGSGFGGTPLGGFHYTTGTYPYLSDELHLGNQHEYNRSIGGPLSDGSTIAMQGNNLVVYDKEGAKWAFAPTGNFQQGYPDRYLVSITRADGEILTYNYSTIPTQGDIRNRLRSIVSSAGYELRVEWSSYSLARVTLVNRRFAYCAPLDTSCRGGAYPWPSIAWSQDTSGSMTATTSGLRSVTYGAMQRGPAVGTSLGLPVYEWNSTITNGAGVARTYTTRSTSANQPMPIYYGPTFYNPGPCIAENLVWRVQEASRTWNYTHAGCGAGDTMRTNPDGSQAQRIGGAYVDELGRQTSYVYRGPWEKKSPHGDIRTISSATYPDGNRVSYVYDDTYGGRVNLQSVTATPSPNSGAPTLTWTRTFPTSCSTATAAYCNKPTYEIDANGNRTDYTYDPVHGGVLTATFPSDASGIHRQIRYSYQQFSARVLNASGQLVNEPPIWRRVAMSTCRTQASCVGTADEIVTTYSYDDSLLPVAETVRAGDNSVSRTIGRAYDPVGNLISVDGPLPGTADTTRFVYDALRRLVAVMGPDPDGAGSLPVFVTRTTYNGENQPTLLESGTAADQSDAALAAMAVNRSVATSYDSSGRKAMEVISSGAVTFGLTQYSYDLRNRLECTALRMNPAVFGSPPASACTAGTAGIAGPDRITRAVYDAASERIQLREGVGTADEAAVATWAFSLNGKVTTMIDGNGNRAELHYDGLDRQDRWTFPSTTRAASYNDATQATALASAGSVNASDYEGYSYDPNGNRTNLRKRDGRNIMFAYDALDRVTSKTYPQGGATAVYFGYDLRSLQTSARYTSQSGEGITNVYDALGRLASTTTNMGGITRTLSYQYDPNGARTRITHPDGEWFQQDHDGLGRPTMLSRQGVPGLALLVYDATGLPFVMGLGNGYARFFGYDGAQRLTWLSQDLAGTAADASWTYPRNPAGQIASVTRDNDAYAWTGHYAVQRPYTTNGLNQYSAAGGTALAYDANGNLISETTAGVTKTYTYDVENRLMSTSAGAALSYDPLGRLYQVSLGSGTTQFLYDGDALVAEYDTAGTLTRRYVHGEGADVPLVQYNGADPNQIRFLYGDQQGSIVAMSNGPGTMTAIDTYDEYGIPGATNQGRFQYTGQAWLSELGMYYYKARIYSPTLGRFLQTDPVGYEGGVNLYAYVGDDPVQRTDSSGTMWSCPPHLEPSRCVDDDETPQPDPDAATQQTDAIVVTGRRQKKFTSGEAISFLSYGTLEQGFRVNSQGIYPVPFTRSGTQTCSHAPSRRANMINLPGIGTDHGGHTHGGGYLDPLPGPEDGTMAAATGRTAYEFSARGAFAIERTASGFRVRLLSGDPLTDAEQTQLRGLVRNWNQHGGGSGATCTFTPD